MTLLELFHLMRKHIKMVVAIPVIAAIVVAAVCFTVLPNTYTATTSMYVLTKTANEEQGALSQSDMTVSQQITNDVVELLKSNRISRDTAAVLGLDDLKGYKISTDSSTNTRVLTLSVTGVDPELAAAIANTMVADASNVAQEVMDVRSINVIDEAAVPTGPSGPNRMLYTVIAFVAGLFIAIALVVIMDMVNTKVRNAEDAEDLLGIPVIGRIPMIKGE